MPSICKGTCDQIAKEQKIVKKEFFSTRKGQNKGLRPIKMNIASISKYCKFCDVRFYLVDYRYCKCCGSMLRARTVHNSLSKIEAQKKLGLELPEKTLIDG